MCVYSKVRYTHLISHVLDDPRLLPEDLHLSSWNRFLLSSMSLSFLFAGLLEHCFLWLLKHFLPVAASCHMPPIIDFCHFWFNPLDLPAEICTIGNNCLSNAASSYEILHPYVITLHTMVLEILCLFILYKFLSRGTELNITVVLCRWLILVLSSYL